MRHVETYKDRHGRTRYYFRRGHGKRTVLPGEPGSDAFMAAYKKALAASPALTVKDGGKTFRALVALYFASPNFKKLAPSSQYCTRNVMERFAAEHGHRMVDQMTREHVDFIIGAKAETPAAANTYLKRLRTLINYAIALRWRRDDPTKGVVKFKEGEFHTWDEAELAQFEAYWPLGTRERTAYALALHTGQRRSDVCRMTWADIVDGRVRVVQAKTKTKLLIPLSGELAMTLDAWPRSHMAIITSGRGAQYTVESFGNRMAEAIKEAGLPDHCVFHGLRKAAARRLAEVGCSASQIAAITGHKNLSEVERYTVAASQVHMADAAITMLANRVTGIPGKKP